MQRIIKKIKSNRGASFIIALIYFIICMMVGATMITAASTNRGRVSASIEEQNAYFAVSSAATTFRDKLINSKYSDYFETYNGGTGDSASYERAVARGDNSVFDTDGDGKPIKPLPNQRFRKDASGNSEDSISQPILDISGVHAKQDETDAFQPIYDVISKYARDIFFNEINAEIDTSKYGSYTRYASHGFEGEMTLEGSNQPVQFSFKMVDNAEEYKSYSNYDIIIEFKNAPDSTDKDYCVTLILKATPVNSTGDGALGEDSQVVKYTVNRLVTDENYNTVLTPVPVTIEIQKNTLDLRWDSAEIIIGSVS